ncbi:MAG: hypothetical protein A6F70_08595 [Cycloclasticus sp. symbiont of Bathymodiolus heckerae]|nr:MAG: hypothetical protein A6F70_08595 [Cycloclasticus sp. symbiont of Bathymodiolus heckerae]
MLDMLPVLLLGLSLGMLHALDADHVMTLSVLTNKQAALKPRLFFSFYWALGHSAMVIGIAVLLFVFDVKVPEQWAMFAEMAIGIMLVLMGFWLMFTFKRERITLHEHAHGGLVHRHWHDEKHVSNTQKSSNVQRAHKPVMVGLLHGFAGSAPVIALVPALAYGELSIVLLYLLVFSAGVMLAMLGFSASYSYCQKLLGERYALFQQYNRQVLALISISVGSIWLTQLA